MFIENAVIYACFETIEMNYEAKKKEMKRNIEREERWSGKLKEKKDEDLNYEKKKNYDEKWTIRKGVSIFSKNMENRENAKNMETREKKL